MSASLRQCLLRILGDPAGHDQAGGQPLEIPFEGSRQRLVKVVDVENRQSLGCRIRAEISEVCVAAGLQANAGGRRARQIRGHHRGGASQERERIGAHASIPDRQQFLDPALALFDQNGDRIGPVGRRHPFTVRAARQFAAERYPSLPALIWTAGRQRHVPVGEVGIHAAIILSYAAGCTCWLLP